MTGAPSGAGEGRTVVVACHEDVPGGATLSVVRLVPALEALGWRLVFWVPRPSDLFDHLQARGLRVAGAPRPIAYSLQALRLPPGLPARAARLPRYLRALSSFLRAERPALVHANSLFTLAEAWLARSAGVPVVFHVHEMVPAGWKGSAARRLAHRLPGEIVGVSEACAADLELNGRRPRVVYEGAEYPDQPPKRSPRPGRTVVGTVGVISTRKGSDIVVEAASLVRALAPEVEFRMIGPATDLLEVEWAARVLERAAALGIEHLPRADVEAALAGWDVFVLPSRRDPCPISLLEAMGSGVAAVGAAVDGIPEQITPESGVLVPPEDPAALADAILALHRDPERRTALGAAASERVRRLFSLERQAKGMHAAYLAALDARESSRSFRRWATRSHGPGG